MTVLEFIIILAVNMLSIIVFYYLKEKGRNFATKEDIGKITEIVENVKKDIQLTITEHSVRFSKLHEIRVEFLLNLYRDLIDLHRIISTRLYELEAAPPNEKVRIFSDINKQLFEYENKYRIYEVLFSSDFCKLMSATFRKYFDITFAIKHGSERLSLIQRQMDVCGRIGTSEADLLDKAIKTIENAWSSFSDDIIQIRELIRSEIRKILGVDNS